jgi:hypothetical protein
MAFPSPSRKETYDNTPSGPDSSRTSPKGSDRASISNSSVNTTTAATSEDLFDYTEQNSDGGPSISDRKSFYSLDKPTSLFRNHSQSTIGTIREAGSVRSSTASSNIPSFEDQDNSPDDLLFKASDPNEARAREARVLESKVARVASRKFSVERVTALQKEVDHWLSEATAADAVRILFSSSSSSLTLPHPQSTALLLSSLLLKTILANHFVSSDSSKAAKNTETSLKLKVVELDLEKRRLEVELRM